LELIRTIIAIDLGPFRSGYKIAHRDCNNSHGVWFRSILVHVCDVQPAQHQAGMDESVTVTELSKTLQRMSRPNFLAAGLMA
jgi:hypothetical protein